MTNYFGERFSINKAITKNTLDGIQTANHEGITPELPMVLNT